MTEALRTTILAEEQKIASKERFGLFSQPPPLAVGDDGNYKQRQHARGEDGKPITKPRNLLGGTNRSGVGKKSYFHVPDSIYKGDEYEDGFRRQMKYQNQMHTKATFHEIDFKPASGYKEVIRSAYEYSEEKPLEGKKRRLDENGRVKTEPRNMTTNPISKVEREFMKNPEYVADPIERKKDMEKRQRQIFLSKLPEFSFKSMSHSKGVFAKDRLTYGLDETAKSMMGSRRQETRTKRMKTEGAFPHEAPFVPAVKQARDTIDKYPKSMSAQVYEPIRSKSLAGPKGEQERWVPNAYSRSRPTPSISLNKKNLIARRSR